MKMVEVGKITLREAGIEPKRRRRAPGHRKRLERKAQEGAMVLWDGSPHHWFGSKSSSCCLMAAIDLKGIETMEEGNRFLQSTFLKDFNRRYIKYRQQEQLSFEF